MSNNPTYTIHIEQVSGGLRVTIPEISVTLTVASTRADEALDAAHNAIIEYQMKRREQEPAASAS